MHQITHHKIKMLHGKNQTAMLTAIAVLLASLVVTAILPTLLVRYVYAGQQLFEQPAVLEYIPVASFVVGVGYFLFAVIGNLLRAQQMKRLDEQMEMEMSMNGDCCGNCGDHGHSHDEMTEVSSLAEALVKEKKSPKSRPASKSKSATKKSAAKK